MPGDNKNAFLYWGDVLGHHAVTGQVCWLIDGLEPVPIFALASAR